MSKVVSHDRWNTKKYTSNWGRFAHKNIKKGRITKSAIKGAVGTGMMSGTMLAYARIRDLNQDKGDDLVWLMKTDKEELGQNEIGLITIGCAIVTMTILGCCWSLMKNKKEETEEGSWTWKKADKDGVVSAEGEMEEKEEKADLNEV